MGERYLKAEERIIREHYPTATRNEILELMPGRTWLQLSAHARKMGVHRTSETWGNSVREGRKSLPDSWTLAENLLLNQFYPQHTRAEICVALPRRAWKAIRCHARRLDIERTREAKVREIQIGRGRCKKRREKETMIMCKREGCDGEVVHGDSEFGRCRECSTIYRFDESGYYYATVEEFVSIGKKRSTYERP